MPWKLSGRSGECALTGPLFRRLCLSITDFHPDTWNPAWSVSTILTGLLSFMVEKGPTLGSIETSDFTVSFRAPLPCGPSALCLGLCSVPELQLPFFSAGGAGWSSHLVPGTTPCPRHCGGDCSALWPRVPRCLSVLLFFTSSLIHTRQWLLLGILGWAEAVPVAQTAGAFSAGSTVLLLAGVYFSIFNRNRV